MTNRVHIDGPSGVIDIEGEKEFVEGLLAKLFPLVEKSGFGSRPSGTSSAEIDPPDADRQTAEDSQQDQTKSRLRKRRAGKRPPAGQSCPARIQVLREQGFFKTQKTPGEIVDGLKANGWTHTTSQVGAATSNLFGRGELQRTKEGNGPWLHYWDRD